MEAHLVEMLGMLLRWLHVIAGIAWVGSSFYFVWLDDSLDPPAPGSEEARKGVSGELWAVHGGGFYNPQKYAVAPARLPEKLHWFKWEAYTTWLSGTALLVIVYWMRAQSMMVDPSVASLTTATGRRVGVASMVGSWIVYDLLCRSPLGRHDGVLAVVVFGLLTLLAWELSRLLGGRAAFIHVGTSIGTIMAANVFFLIIPGQRRMVAAMRAGKKPNPLDGIRGKQRSVHNNYFTLPVVFIMISNHYAATYSHPEAWAVLALICAAGRPDPAFLQPQAQGGVRLAVPCRGRGAARRGRRLDRAAYPGPAAGRGPGDLGPGPVDRRPALRDLPLAGADVHRHHPAPRRGDSDERGRDRAERAAHLPAGRGHPDHAARQRHADHRRGARGDRGLGGGRRARKLAPAALRD